MSWELAVALGSLQERVAALERDMATIRHWAMRFAIIVALWLTAVVMNLNAEQFAQLLIGLLKAL
jgi:hypothetical protein